MLTLHASPAPLLRLRPCFVLATLRLMHNYYYINIYVDIIYLYNTIIIAVDSGGWLGFCLHLAL